MGFRTILLDVTELLRAQPSAETRAAAVTPAEPAVDASAKPNGEAGPAKLSLASTDLETVRESS